MKQKEERRDIRSHVRTALYEADTGTESTGGIPKLSTEVLPSADQCGFDRWPTEECAATSSWITCRLASWCLHCASTSPHPRTSVRGFYTVRHIQAQSRPGAEQANSVAGCDRGGEAAVRAEPA